MILLVDIGNSRSKWVLTNQESGVKWNMSGQWNNQGFDKEHWLTQLNAVKGSVNQEFGANVEAIAISCVADEAVWKILKDSCEQVFAIKPYLPQSTSEYRSGKGAVLVNSYKVEEALGIDRWLAMVAGVEFAGRAFAVIDAGTAITLDVVDANGRHLGGQIVPGQKLMQSSLLGNTGRIAWSAQHNRETQPDSRWLATSTQHAIEMGALNASVAYLEFSIDKLCHQFQLETVIMTGGDAEQLIDLLDVKSKKYLTYNKDLVLQGLFYCFMNNSAKKR